MMNTKNVLLSLGAGIGALWLIYSVFVTAITMAENESSFHISSVLWIVLAVVAMIVSPILVVFRNIKNTPSKPLAILSIAFNVWFAVLFAYKSFTVSVPQYLVISEIGKAEIFLTMFISFLKSGGITALTGSVLIIIGAILSLRKT